jgi:DNA (cytosine-5)-methyltransferase 1
VCSGIEAASVAWHPLGWEPLAFSEIEAFPRAVLAHHYPDVPCHGDFTVLKDQPWIVDADVLVGGTPCQAFSVAGLRNSLDDARGNLSLEFIRLADAIDAAREAQGRDPSVIVWENVPGVLSVKDNAFGCLLAALAGDAAPYVPPRGKWTNAGVVDGPTRQVAWRVLDAQFFGLAQRRRRVFVVASARDGFDPAAVLLEFEGVRRDTPPRRETRQDPAADASSGADERRSHWDGVEHPHPTLSQSFSTGAIGYSNQELFSQRRAGLVGEASTGYISHCLNAGGMGRQDYETETLVTHALRGEGFDGSEDGTGRGTPTGTDKTVRVASYTAGSLKVGGGKPGQGYPAVIHHMAVRRLTPVECERLQGFPDDYTMIPWKKKPADQCPDGPRYKALGNSMAVPVMRWIGKRIAEALR